MPELPEISYFKKYIDATALHQKIKKVSFGDSKPLQVSKVKFKEALVDHQLKESRRFGKYLFLKSTEGAWLVFHFGMSGKFSYSTQKDIPEHAVLTLFFSDGAHLSFVCPRKFGKIYLTESAEKFKETLKLGRDALKIHQQEFQEIVEGSRKSIKSILTDQHRIAGIGNLYADEILFHSKIHPKTKAAKLIPKEIDSIFKNIPKILNKVIKAKTEDSSLPESWLISHRKAGAECPVCKGKIKQLKISGRSTYYCPNCQKEKS